MNRHEARLQRQLRTVALIGDVSLWCMNMANKGGELGEMHSVHLYRLAEALTNLRWAVVAQGVDPADIEPMLRRLEDIADAYPTAFKLVAALREVDEAARACLQA